ncbi:MAG: pyruvate kinase [Rhodospirillaceae bacterium]|jgi:pyruvate kinase|nr:pyruvate kinase [Rhodospirillaceae bacterium]MBT5040608.1 pyruvate kinase [Rhodospirillaceae bacterium]MBT5674637.1 pyruvate kinase [Rhodospirillaceae bacterium]MBT5779156.1 pyruvate kinase [Rhodospirillaceae bacterium]MBT7291448.1 pyruvate kinase [Rhodospirillaceae bacterium]
MRRHRRAKIVATLGPASSTRDCIHALFDAGVDMFRFNFSHGTHDEHRARYDIVREIEAEVGRPIAVMADLQGPKLRVGEFENGEAMLKQGNAFRLDLSPERGDAHRAPLPHPEIFSALEDGAEILLDDGRIRLSVTSHGKDFADTIVQAGGKLSDHKGVNLPRVALGLSAITSKDQRDLRFALEMGVDWVALSFVQRPDDVASARKLIAGRASIMTKLEKPAALDSLAEIIDLSDAIMVARGDLGVELAPEDVPAEQKNIVRAARRAGKPVVVATQMLESMIYAAAPTRAEASDVATAVYDGADGLMLSAESAAGDYPVESVAMMNRIIERVERDPAYRVFIESQNYDPESTPADAITAAARQVAETVHAAAVVTYTTSGSTALRAARERPGVPILALTPELQTARRLAIVWGVHCLHTEDAIDFQDMVEKACTAAREQEFARLGDRIVITAGVPFGTPGSTNVLRIAWVGN